MVASFARQSFTRLRYPSDDDGHGNDEPDMDATPAELTVSGCSIQPGLSVEVLGGREAERIAWTVYAPPGSDVTATDYARVGDGETIYRVSGEPQRWIGPTAATTHDVILLEVWKG